MDSSLRTAAKQALDAMESAEVDPHSSDDIHKAITALKAALVEDAMQKFTDVNQELEAALAEPVEPVAWRYELATTIHENEYGGWAQLITPCKPNVPEGSIRNLTPLYIAPPQRPSEPVQDVKGCDHCNHPMYAAIKCKVCGRVTEPVQEPYAWMSVGGSIWRHKTREDDVPLYTAPRTPLAEWQINDLMSDIDPEDRDSWSFRQGVYAAEKHHGVRR